MAASGLPAHSLCPSGIQKQMGHRLIPYGYAWRKSQFPYVRCVIVRMGGCICAMLRSIRLPVAQGVRSLDQPLTTGTKARRTRLTTPATSPPTFTVGGCGRGRAGVGAVATPASTRMSPPVARQFNCKCLTWRHWMWHTWLWVARNICGTEGRFNLDPADSAVF